jgi:hypothetical protein
MRVLNVSSLVLESPKYDVKIHEAPTGELYGTKRSLVGLLGRKINENAGPAGRRRVRLEGGGEWGFGQLYGNS